MHQIDSSSVRGGQVDGKILMPNGFSANCPKCSEKVVFSIYQYYNRGPQNSISADARCPSCDFRVGFWSLNPEGSMYLQHGKYFISPPPKSRISAPQELDGIPIQLQKAFISTIDCYNSGIYTAAAVSGRGTLEGIFKYLVPEDKRNLPLYRLIEIAKDETDLAAPLNSLSHAIRAGGNLGAHFDMEHEPDENVARQIVELLSYLISFLYILPAKIKQLEDDLGKVEAKEL